MRAQLLANGGRCAACGERRPELLQLDHKIPLREAPHLQLSAGNVQLLCLDCHEIKTGIERSRRASSARFPRY